MKDFGTQKAYNKLNTLLIRLTRIIRSFNFIIKMKKDKLKRTYTFFDKIELAWFLIRTKLINKNIRLIRFPFILRGKQYIDFGKNLTTGYGCRFEVFPADEDSRVRLILGNDIQVNDFVHLSAIDNVQIGDNCLIASHVYISDNTHGVYGGG